MSEEQTSGHPLLFTAWHVVMSVVGVIISYLYVWGYRWYLSLLLIVSFGALGLIWSTLLYYSWTKPEGAL